jgi:REP-associated tyrosine transposase
MARPLRLDFSGAIHHITARGNGRKNIFRTDLDRRKFLELLGETVRRYGWLITAWTLMSNHFHLVVETPTPTLSAGMQWLLGTYSQWFNKKHKRSGHLFGDRFHSFLIDQDAYLTEVVRYVVLNAVRAKIVERPELYRWSSYRATAGLEAAPPWLAIDRLKPLFVDLPDWQSNYATFVAAKIGSTESLWDGVRHGIFLGTDLWMQKVQKIVESKPRSSDHPTEQRAVGRPYMTRVIETVAKLANVPQAEIRDGRGGPLRMLCAWLGRYEGWHRLTLIAASLRLSSSGRISDLIESCERRLRWDAPMNEILDLALPLLRV